MFEETATMASQSYPNKPIKRICSLTSFVIVASTFLLPAISQGIGLPIGWEKAVVIVEMRCGNMPSMPCEKLPDDVKPKCSEFCKSPNGSCPVQCLDFCEGPENYCPIATGFIMKICDLALLISNRHVLEASQYGVPLFVRARLKSTGEPIRLTVAEVHGHPNPHFDLAACRLRYSKSVQQEDIDLGIINEDVYRKAGATVLAPLSAVRAGDEAVFSGFPLVVAGVRALITDQETPLTRSGIVSIVLPGETRIGKRYVHDVFLVDSWAFQGNSGSPVIIPPFPNKYKNDDRNSQRAHLVGVVSAFLDLNAPIEKAVVVGGVRAKVNSGLAIVQSLDGIESMVQQFKGANCVPIADGETDDQSAKSQSKTD